jgi:hypothetical protein
MTALAGLAVAAFSSPALFAQGDAAPSGSKRAKRMATAKRAPRAASDDSSDDSPKTGSAKPASGTAQQPPDDSDGAAADPSPTVLSISNPRTTDDAWKQWQQGRGRNEYNNRVHAGELNGDALQIISNGIREQIYALSLPTQRDNLGTIIAGVLRSVYVAADAKDPSTQRTVRVAMIKEIIKHCRELGDNQFYVRLNAAILLGHLFVVPENTANHVAPEFYTDAFDALMEVLERKDQPQGIKVAAVVGLRNAAIYSNPPLEPSRKIRMATKLREELEKADTCEWYQELLCETLGSLDQVYDLDGKPFIVHALAKALYDQNRSLCARAAAAKALGRAQLPPTIDLNVVAYGIADLSRQIVEARNVNKKHVSRWCIMDVLLAFKPKDLTEKARRAGLLDRVDEPTYQKYKESIKGVYDLIRPLVVQELKEADSAFPPKALDHIVEWLKNHIPAQLRIAPGLPPLATTQVTKTEQTKAEPRP